MTKKNNINSDTDINTNSDADASFGTDADRRLKQDSVALPYVAARIRAALSDVYFGLQQLAPSEQRAQDKALDERAAVVERGFYRLLRLSANLSSADRFVNETPLCMSDEDLAALCRGVCMRARPLMKKCNIRLRFSAAPQAVITAIDKAAIERVLLNLLSNAMKALPNGGNVTVTLHLSEDRQRVILVVRDDGVGLDKNLPNPPFTMQLNHAAASDPNGGLGVGLALCRNIIEGHEGSIVLSDAPSEKGTQATVSLPMRRQGAPSLHDEPTDYLGGFDHVLAELSDSLLPTGFYHQPSDGKDDIFGEDEE